MIEKDYPVLLRFNINKKLYLILDVKYIGGYYFENYIVTLENGYGYINVLFESISEREAIEKFNYYSNLKELWNQ